MDHPQIGHKSGCVTINCPGCGTDFYSVDYSGVTTREQAERLAHYNRLKEKTDRWDKLSYDEQQRRMLVWRHNSLLGHVAMARSNMRAVGTVSSTSDRARNIADQIVEKLEALDKELRENRVAR